jgi:P27 family predicted phage terminase small subunit
VPRAEAPAKLKLLHGRGPGVDSGGRPVKTPPPFARIPPKPPTWLSKEALAEWRRVTPGLERLELLKEEDRALLAAYCETWATYVEATRRLHREGLTHMSSQGEIAHPCVAIARAAGKELRGLASQFGLSPSAEMALGKVQGNDDHDNPFS